jgi:hypothetical protein
VIVSLLKLDSAEQAVIVFERINNRGLPLGNSDLIKNIIFMSIHSEVNVEDHKVISESWSEASEILFNCSEPHLRSLDYLLKANLLPLIGEPANATKVLKLWREKITNRDQAMSFAEDLPSSARSLVKIVKGNNFQNHPTHESYGTKFFGSVQQFPVLLAGKNLSEEAYKKISHMIEGRTILSILAKERPQELEKIIPKWAKVISNCKTVEDLETNKDLFTNDISILLKRAETEFDFLSYSKAPQKKRIRYILARISRQAQIDAQETNVPNLDEFLKTTSKTKGVEIKGYDLEHIYPKKPKNKLVLDDGLADSIGNLVLAHPIDQRSASNAYPKNKVDLYQKSKLILTQSLVKIELLNNCNEREINVVNNFRLIAPVVLENWSTDEIAKRKKLYWDLLSKDILSNFNF